MKIFTLAPNENWICDRIVSEWYSYFPEISTTSIDDADIVWLQAGWCWNHLHVNILKEKKIICTEHHIVPEKFDQNALSEFKFRDQFVDYYHVPNPRTAGIVKQLSNKPIKIINYWYDPKKWYSSDRVEEKKKLGLDPNKYIVGSFQRDSEGESDRPKLEKGPDLFCDYVEKIAKEKPVHVLLGGWRRKYVIKRLNAAGIPYTMIELASIEKLKPNPPD